MNCSLACASVSADAKSAPAAATPSTRALGLKNFSIVLPPFGMMPRPAVVCLFVKLIRERPRAQFFLADVPQPRQSQGFHDQEKNDQSPEDHRFEVRDHPRLNGDAAPCCHI